MVNVNYDFLNKVKPQQPAPVAPETPKEELAAPKREYFVNDLTEEEREQAVSEYAKRIREQLSGDKISINCMSRLLNVSHPKVTALLQISTSAKEALLDQNTSRVVRAKSLLSKLTDEQRELLLNQMKSETHS